jgi:hypothetical protein
MQLETFDCELKHGIKLTIEGPAKATLRDVAQFLAQAMAQFKEHRDVCKTGDYADGPYSGPIVRRRRQVARCILSHPGDEHGTYLTAASWTDAVLKAYVNADTLLQMIGALPVVSQHAAQEGGWLSDVVAVLKKPNGELHALARMIRRDIQA